MKRKKLVSENVSQSFFIKNVYGENNVLTAATAAASTAKGYAICYFLYFLFALLCPVEKKKLGINGEYARCVRQIAAQNDGQYYLGHFD